MSEVRPLPRLSPRPRAAHKSEFGRLLFVAGSRQYTGAAALAATAAVRSGAGMVFLAAPASVQPIVAAKVTGPIVHALPETDAGALSLAALEPLRELAATCDVAAVGPGLSAAPETLELVRRFVGELARPVVLDADGLNAYAGRASELGSRRAPTVLTPHEGEMARLLGRPATPPARPAADAPAGKKGAALAEKAADAVRLTLARAFAAQHTVVLLLKGWRTVVTDGESWFVNQTGNPGMAKGGAGDVLTGLLAALLGQGLSAFDAARLGAHLHGLAGDLAAQELGEISLAPGDLIEYLPAAFRKHQGGGKK